MSTKRPHTHSTYKSAKDGKFVTKEFAKKQPATTFKETTRNPKKKNSCF